MTDESTTPTPELFRPAPDPSRSESKKSARVRKKQAEIGKQRVQDRADDATPRENPIVNDETYGALLEDNRVVMRHKIALNLDSFRSSSDEFTARPERTWPALEETAPPFFSVVIPNFNGERHLVTVLRALSRQTLPDFEVIVVDDASMDDSVARVEHDFPEARLIVNRQNLGFAASCNSGAAAAAGRFLILLNSDTEPDERWLEEVARGVVSHPEAAAFACKLLLFDRRDTLHTAGDVLGRDGIARNRGVWEVDRGQYDADSNIFSACGGAAVYRRDVWQALGGYDEDFWMYLEDVDFGFRARLAGWETVYLPAARVYHRLSASGGDVLASYYVGRNGIWLVAKNYPGRLLWAHLAAILGGQVRVAIDALRNMRGEAARARLRGQYAGIVGLPRILAQRKVVQQRRIVKDSEIERLLA